MTGARAPRLVTRVMLKEMRPRAVIVDVAIDQGGCVETSRPTTHSKPTYIVDDVVHYCVTNMPGAVGRTSTFALCNVTLPWALILANRGMPAADFGILEQIDLALWRAAYVSRVTVEHKLLAGDEPDIEAVIRRALAKEPQDRFASAGELAAAVRSALAGQSVPAYSAPVATSSPRRTTTDRPPRS